MNLEVTITKEMLEDKEVQKLVADAFYKYYGASIKMGIDREIKEEIAKKEIPNALDGLIKHKLREILYTAEFMDKLATETFKKFKKEIISSAARAVVDKETMAKAIVAELFSELKKEKE